MGETMTNDEMRFVERMAYHVRRGATLTEAAAAVIDDDRRLLVELCRKRQDRTKPEQVGDAIVTALSNEVYRRIRQQNA